MPAGRFSSALFVSGAHVDLSGRLDAAPRMGASNPGRIIAQPGGGGLNMASNAVEFGLASTLASPVGADENSAWLRRVLAERGVGDALVEVVGETTGAFVSVIAPDGDMVIGLADLAIHEKVDADWFLANCAEAFEAADGWVLNANLTPDTLVDLADRAVGKFLAAATISQAKAERLAPILGRLDCIFANLGEARVLSGLPDAGQQELVAALRKSGVRSGTISAGAGAVFGWQDSEFFEFHPPGVDEIADVNGAGDALAGTVMAGLSMGLAMDKCLALGIAASQWTIRSPSPFRPGLGFEELRKRAAEIEAARSMG